MKNESLACPDDCPIQNLCAEVYETLSLATISLEGLKRQTEEVKAEASEGVGKVRQIEGDVSKLDFEELFGGFMEIASKAIDISSDERQLLELLSKDLKLWRALIENARRNCDGPKLSKRFWIVGQQILKCSLKPAEVLEIFRMIQADLVYDAAAQDFDTSIEDS